MSATGIVAPLPEYVCGLDGKKYPRRRMSTAARDQVAGHVHYLAHDDGLSVREIVKALAGLDIHRSVGWVHAILKTWICTGCSGLAFDEPERECSGGADWPPEHRDRVTVQGPEIRNLNSLTEAAS